MILNRFFGYFNSKNILSLLLVYTKNNISLFLVYPLFIIRIKQEIINSKDKQSLFLVYSNFILCLFLVYFKNKQRINKDLKSFLTSNVTILGAINEKHK